MAVEPDLAILLNQERAAVAAGRYEDARAIGQAAGRRARALADGASMIEVGGRLERLLDFAGAWSLLADAPLLKMPVDRPEWEGAELKGRSILVQRRVRHTGSELRLGRLLGAAAAAGAEVIVATEARLVPLFTRSFPAVTTLSRNADARLPLTDIGASYERLAQYLWATPAAIRSQFRPLQADHGATLEFRRRYTHDQDQVIGIAWFSVNDRKQLPPLGLWSTLMALVPAAFVSLQYDAVASGALARQTDRHRRYRAIHSMISISLLLKSKRWTSW